MPNQPTDKFPWKLAHEVNRLPSKYLDKLESYAASDSDGPALDVEWWDKFFLPYSKDQIKAAVESERIFRATTLEDWLEIARDFYQDATGTDRRPKLLEDEFVLFLKLNEKHGSGDPEFQPEPFLNAVWTLGKDAKVDHTTFETLPWYSPEDEDGYCTLPCWHNYLGESLKLFRKYRPNYDEPELTAEEPEPVPDDGLMPAPNCRPRAHMPKSPFAIYDFATALSVKKGDECWLSRKTCAKWAMMDPATARRAIQWLVDNGWLIELKKPRKGLGGQGQYRVVSHEDWVTAKGSSYCVRVKKENDEAK